MSAPTRRVVAYLRVSKTREGQTSLRSQRRSVKAYCDDRSWDLVEVCVDNGRSAFNEKVPRPGLDRAQELIVAGAVDCLMVWKLDRFVRSTADFEKRWKVLQAHEAEFVSITDNFDTTTAMGKAMLKIAVVFAELESGIKSDRAGAWHGDRRANKAPPTGPRPYGYRRERNRLIVVAAEAKVIRQAAKQVIGGASLRSIVRDLEAAGVKGKSGEPLSQRALRAILIGPTIAACREITPGVFVDCESDDWKPILDRATWDQVRDVLMDPARRTSPSNRRRWLLSGIAECGNDGTKMKSQGHKTGPRYFCPQCQLSIGQARTDEIVTGDLFAFLDAKVWRRLRQGQSTGKVDIAAFEAAMHELTSRFVAGEINAEELALTAEGLQRQQEVAATPPPPLPDVRDLGAAWNTLDLEQQRLVVMTATKSLTIMPSPGTLGFEARIRWEPVE